MSVFTFKNKTTINRAKTSLQVKEIYKSRLYLNHFRSSLSKCLNALDIDFLTININMIYFITFLCSFKGFLFLVDYSDHGFCGCRLFSPNVYT